MNKKTKKILLMLPLRDRESNDFFYVPDLGLGYVAAGLRKYSGEDVEVKLLIKDLRLSDEQFAAYLTRHSFEFVGIKVFSDAVDNVKRTVALVRRVLPDATVIAGGPHVNAIPEDALTTLKFDYAICGEGEQSLAGLINALGEDPQKRAGSLSQIEGLVWKEGQAVRCNNPALLKDLDCVPAPSWDLMSPLTFGRNESRYCRQYPAAPITLTRGCSYRCSFCSQAGTQFRKRSLGSVMTEIDGLRTKYGIKEFHVLDDNCAYDKQFMMSLCEQLMRLQRGLSWRVPGGICVNSLDAELCRRMFESGCYETWVGIESGSQRILDAMHKGITLDKIRTAIFSAKQQGLKVGGFFILGYPGETDDDRRQTISLALALPLDYVKFTIFIPQPGTEIFNHLRETGDLKDASRVIKCADNEFENTFTNLTARELRSVHQKYSLRFYARPRIMAQLLKEYHSPAKMAYVVRAARQFIFDRRASW